MSHYRGWQQGSADKEQISAAVTRKHDQNSPVAAS
jgi:hypothetical protein